MARMKTFFIYLLIGVSFLIFSNLMIYVGINTMYNNKEVIINSQLPIIAEVQATSINGKVKCEVENNTSEVIKNKYIKIEFYSKNDVLMGTKYIKIERINAKEKENFEIRFNYNKVDKAQISIVDEIDNIPEEEKKSDPELNLFTTISALFVLYFIL